MAQDNISKFYQAFNEKYDNFASEQEFRDFLKGASRENIDNLYNAFNSVYDNFGTSDEMVSYLGWADASAAKPVEAAPASAPARVADTTAATPPSAPTADEIRAQRDERRRNAAEGRAMFDQMRQSRKPATSPVSFTPSATQAAQVSEPAPGQADEEQPEVNAFPSRNDLAKELEQLKAEQAAVQEDIDFVKEYDRRAEEDKRRNQMVSGVNPLSGVANRGAGAKWLEDNKARYEEAKARAGDIEARVLQVQTAIEVPKLKAERKADQEKLNEGWRKAVMSGPRGSVPFTATEKDKEDDLNNAAALSMRSQAIQTYEQGSKYDSGYEGNWMDQMWTAVSQFAEGAANNIDMGSFTGGLTEASASMQARKAGEKKSAIIDETFKDLGYTDGKVDGLLESMDAQAKKLRPLAEALDALGGEIKAMEATLSDLEKGGDEAAYREYYKKYKAKADEYGKLYEEYKPVEEEYNKYVTDYETLQNAIEANVDKGLTESEKNVLDAFDEFLQAKIAREGNVSVAAQAGAGAEQSAEFMLDFLLTGGFSKAGAKAASKLASRNLMKRVFGESGAKMAANILTDAGVSVARTGVMFPRNLAAYGEQLLEVAGEGKDQYGRYQFNRSKLNAALNTALTQYIEYWSEGFGEYFGAAEQALFRKATKWAPVTAIGQTLKNYRGSIGKYLDYGKFDGMFNEMLEEVVGSTFNSVAGWLSGDRVGDSEALKQFFAGDQLATLFFSFLPMSAISAGTNVRAYNQMKSRYDEGVRMLDPLIQSGAVNRQDLQDLADELKDMTPEQIKDNVVAIADVARANNGGRLPNGFAQGLMGYLEGSFALNLDSGTWRDSQEKMSVANAYASQYSNPYVGSAYDLKQAETETREAAVAAGFDDNTLDGDAFMLARQAQAIADTEPERAQALMDYADAKAARSGLRDGYDAETEQGFYRIEENVRRNVYKNGSVTLADFGDGQGRPVYITSEDTDVTPDGKLSTPTGPDGLVTYVETPDGQPKTVKASEFARAEAMTLGGFLADAREQYYNQRNQEFEQAESTASPAAMTRAIAEKQGQTVTVRDGNGVSMPIEIVRMTGDGTGVVVRGDKDFLQGLAASMGMNVPASGQIEVPTSRLYPMLEQNDDGTIETDTTTDEGNEPEPAPQPEPETPPTPPAPAPAAAEPETGGVTLDGRPVTVSRIDDENGWAYFSYADDRDGIQQVMDLDEFKRKTGYGAEPAPAPAPAPATEPAPQPEPQPAEEEVPKDFRGNPIPMKDGEVDETTFRENDPEAWAAWADSLPDDDERKPSLGTKKRLEGLAKSANAAAEKAQKELEKLYDSGADDSKVRDKEKELKAHRARQKKYEDALKAIAKRELDAAEAEREAAAEAERRRKEQEAAAAAAAEKGGEKDVPDVSNDTPEAAQKRGFIMQNGQRIDRPIEGGAILADGADTKIAFSKSVAVDGKYGLMNSQYIVPSHVNDQENPLHFFAKKWQPKNRKKADSAVAIQQMANSLRPGEITRGETAYGGAPIVNARGEVIQGNGRGEALRRAYEQGSAKEYKEWLAEHAEEFGFTREMVEELDYPILVRVLDVDDARAEELGKFVQADLESGGDQTFSGKGLAKKLGDRLEEFLDMLFDGDLGEDATLSDYINKNGQNALRWLHRNGFINDTEYQNAFETTRSGDTKFTEATVASFREVALEPLFANAPEKVRAGYDLLPNNVKLALQRSVAMLSGLEGVLPDVQEAIGYFHDFETADPAFKKAKNVDEAAQAVADWMNNLQLETGMSEGDLHPNVVARMLAARFKGTKTIKGLTDLFKAVASAMSGEGGLFGTDEAKDNVGAYRDAGIITEEQENKIRNGEEVDNNGGSGSGNVVAGGEGGQMGPGVPGSGPQAPAEAGGGAGPAEGTTGPVQPEVKEEPKEAPKEPQKPKEPELAAGTKAVAGFAKELGFTPVVVRKVEDIPESESRAREKAETEGLDKVQAWVNTATGQVFIVDGSIGEDEAQAVVQHEIVAHIGLPQLLGQEDYDKLCDAVWDGMSEDDSILFGLYAMGATAPSSAETYEDKVAWAKGILAQFSQADIDKINSPVVSRRAASEYMASLAQKVDFSQEDRNVWERIKDAFRVFLTRMKIALGGEITNEDIVTLIQASRTNLAEVARTEQEKAIAILTLPEAVLSQADKDRMLELMRMAGATEDELLGARRFLSGENVGLIAQAGYMNGKQKALEYVRSRPDNLQSDRRAENAAQLDERAPENQGPDAGVASGGQPVVLAEEGSGEEVPEGGNGPAAGGAGATGTDGERGDNLVPGEGGGLPGSDTGGQHSGRGSGTRGDGQKPRSKRTGGQDGGSNAQGNNGGSAGAGTDVNSAASEVDSILAELDGLGSDATQFALKGAPTAGKLNASDRKQGAITLEGKSPEQISLIAKLGKALAKAGYALIQSGVRAFNLWSAQMKARFGQKLSENKVLRLTDEQVDAYIAEIWESDYEIDGRVMRVREWADEIGREALRNVMALSEGEKRKLQKAADKVVPVFNDMANIREMLPFLLPDQQEDVLKAETQFFDPSHADREHGYGKGYLFTNGTGTGKTFTGAGIIKRFVKSGRGRVLIITPTQNKVSDWVKESQRIDLDVNPLADTSDVGEGVVCTTYANYIANKNLMDVDFDLIVYDEAHNITKDIHGNTDTSRLRAHQMLANKDEEYALERLTTYSPFFRQLNDWREQVENNRAKIEEYMERIQQDGPTMTKPDGTTVNLNSEVTRLESENRRIQLKIAEAEPHIQEETEKLKPRAKEAAKKTKVVFLSASAFATHASLEYAEGFIFSYPELERTPEGADKKAIQEMKQAKFLLDRFPHGYKRKSAKKAEQRVTDADRLEEEEVSFTEYLFNGIHTASGRTLVTDHDYARKFPTLSLEMADRVNSAVNAIETDAQLRPLKDALKKTLYDYNYGNALLETMKATLIVPYIKQFLAKGRKVVVFHSRLTSREALEPPFQRILELAETLAQNDDSVDEGAVLAAQMRFRDMFSDVLAWEQRLDYTLPREQLVKAFGRDNVLLYSGQESKNVKEKNVEKFQGDNSGKDLIVVQVQSGSEGISLHDKTGKHERVTINLSLPRSPILAIQGEGRTLRIGSASNAIFWYPLLGLDFEQHIFANIFAGRAGTQENLSMGPMARGLRDSFMNGILEHSGVVDIDEDTGGKAYDSKKSDGEATYEKAVQYYHESASHPILGVEDQPDGMPTPEPLGFKMVQWAALQDGESVLEPSAGRGAIARFVLKKNRLKGIDSVSSLVNHLMLKLSGGGRNFEVADFLTGYDIHNKHDVVLMNPPSGEKGDKARQHVSKAFKHLVEGGRLVAVVPSDMSVAGIDDSAMLTGEILLPAVASGARGQMKVIILDKVTRKGARAKMNEYKNVDLSGAMTMDQFFARLKDVDMPGRKIDSSAKIEKAVNSLKKALKVEGTKGIIREDNKAWVPEVNPVKKKELWSRRRGLPGLEELDDDSVVGFRVRFLKTKNSYAYSLSAKDNESEFIIASPSQLREEIIFVKERIEALSRASDRGNLKRSGDHVLEYYQKVYDVLLTAAGVTEDEVEGRWFPFGELSEEEKALRDKVYSSTDEEIADIANEWYQRWWRGTGAESARALRMRNIIDAAKQDLEDGTVQRRKKESGWKALGTLSEDEKQLRDTLKRLPLMQIKSYQQMFDQQMLNLQDKESAEYRTLWRMSKIAESVHQDAVDEINGIISKYGYSIKRQGTAEGLEQMFKDFSKDGYNSKLFESLLPVIKRLATKVLFTDNYSDSTLGSYNSGNNQLLLNASSVKDSADMAVTILHELIHDATTYAQYGRERGKISQEGELGRAALRTNRMWQALLLSPTRPSWEYPLKNDRELLAGISDSSFREWLAGVDVYVDNAERPARYSIFNSPTTPIKSNGLTELEHIIDSFLANASAYEHSHVTVPDDRSEVHQHNVASENGEAENESFENGLLFRDGEGEITGNNANFVSDDRIRGLQTGNGESAQGELGTVQGNADRGGREGVGSASAANTAATSEGRMALLNEGLAVERDEYLASRNPGSGRGADGADSGTGRYTSREDAERRASEALVRLAKENGFFIEPDKVRGKFGLTYERQGYESLTFLSRDKKVFTKFKNPFTVRSKFKGPHTPFDVVRELEAHNRLFPSTSYRFIGVTEIGGVARLVIQQDAVSVAAPLNTRQVAYLFAIMGFDFERWSESGRDGKVGVYDLGQSNAVVDKDGGVRVIDPVIQFLEEPDAAVGSLNGFRGVAISDILASSVEHPTVASIVNAIERFDIGQAIDEDAAYREIYQALGDLASRLNPTNDIEGDILSEIERILAKYKSWEEARDNSWFVVDVHGLNAVAMGFIDKPAKRQRSDNGQTYREETDEDVLERLDSEPKVTAYRAMQFVPDPNGDWEFDLGDGKGMQKGFLYPPMSAKVNGEWRPPVRKGKWERSVEQPELAREDGTFWLDRGDEGGVWAAYNPYFHSSGTMLNDQFKKAQSRDNLVVVEVEIPEREVSASNMNPYHAEKAKNSVGKIDWNAGVIQKQLTGTRPVYLSRWDKPMRIVPVNEVADNVAEMVKGQVETFPTNVVWPQLRAELEKRGVKFVETDNKGNIVGGKNKGKSYGSVYGVLTKEEEKRREKERKKAKNEREAARERIRAAEREATNTILDRMGEELGIQINRVPRFAMPVGHKSAKGYYNPYTGEMTICMDNVTDQRDAVATVFHETVAHHGLRKLLGDRFNEAMVRIYAALDAKGKRWVNSYMERHGLKPGDTDAIILGMEEYMAHLAESGDFKNSTWERIKEIFGVIIDKLFGTDGFVFTDRELNYILRAAYEQLKNPNWINTVPGWAKDTVMKRELGINETDPNRPTDPDGPGTGLRYRDGDTGRANEDYNNEMELWHNKMLIENQNADLPVKIGMEKVMKETGRTDLPEDEDYLTRHNLASSRAESEAHNFELFHFKPLLEQVQAVQSILLGDKTDKDSRQREYERILDYMYAVSGLERNKYKNDEIEQQKQDALAKESDPVVAAQIEKRFEEMKKDWSGITSLMGRPETEWKEAEADARAMIDAFEGEVGDKAELDALWDRVRDCTDFNLEHAYRYGLLTREEFERLHGTSSQPRMWEYYLPLRGFSEETAEERYGYSTFTQPSTNGVVVKKMKGRWTQADNPLANILNIAETEIVQGNDNWAKQALLKFVQTAGNNTLLTEVEPWYVKNPSTGKWELAEPAPGQSLEDFERNMRETMENEWTNDLPHTVKKGRRGLKLDNIMVNKAHRNEHMIRLKVSGMDKAIWVNGNPALAKAVTGIGRAQNMQWLRRASRVLSNLFTTYSLDFSVKNLIRDTIYSRTALLVKEDRAYRRQFAKNWRKNFGYGAFAYPMVRLAASWDSGKLQSIPADQRTKKQQMFIDFMTDGGQTGYTIINSVNEIKRDLERSMRRGGKDVGGVTVPILGHYAKAVKTLNEGFELLTRFTAYETSRDMGRSGQRSASDAKEISVNFNRRGAQSGEGVWGNIAAYLGATHYFYNAGVQGFDNFLRLFKTSPQKMTPITAGIVMMGILTPLINSMIAGAAGGGDGDDDWYWNLPEWVRRNNLVLGTGRTYLAIPLPVEFRAIYGLGDIAAAAFCYQKYPNRTFGRVAGDMISTASGILPVNPVEGYTGNGNIGDAIIRAVAPDAGMFFVDWATNRDYTGRPLWKENPFSETVPKSQGAYASTPKGIVNACQKLAEISAGAIDVPPGLVRDFMNNYGGGFFRAAEDVSKIMTGVIGKDPDRPFRYDNLPFLSGFTGHIDEDRSNAFATNALREYKDISDGIVKKVNAICNTNDITAAMVYGDKEIPEEYASKVRVQRILSGKDYRIGKEYRDGMNNKYKMKQYVRGDKIGQWYKSKEVEEYGINSLKQTWKDLRDEWAAMPHKTEEEKSARAEKYLEVDDAWHRYYDAEGDLAENLMKIEYGKK